MVKMKEHNQELFFVEVRDPIDLRRNLLQTLKDVLESMQKFEKFKALRHEKLEQINKLRILLKDTNKLLGKLKLKMPQTNLRAMVIQEQKKQKKAEEKNTKKEKVQERLHESPRKELSDIEKLESEINAIEGKLKNLA